MMIGIRTPVKRASPSAQQGRSPSGAKEDQNPTQHQVRKSVGEWEAGTGPSRRLATPPIQTSLRGIKPQTTESSVKDDPIAEARKHVAQIKSQMEESRNLKTQIKNEITKRVDELLKLVKRIVTGTTPLSGNNKNIGPKKQMTLSPSMPKPPSERKEVDALENETGTLKKMLEEHSKKLTENAEKIDRLTETLRTSQQNFEQCSYASAAASQPEIQQQQQQPRHTALHSIAVTTEDDQMTGDAVIGKISKAIEAKDDWIRVEKVRKTKNRKIIMSFRTEEDRDKVKRKINKKGTDLAAEDVKNRDPLLILKDVLSTNTDEEVLRAMRNQNPEVFRDLNTEDSRIAIKYRKKARNPHTMHIVASTSPKIWQRITGRGYVYIDLQRIRAQDQSPLLQCSLCLGYGHSRRLCTETVPKCSHCGGPHMRGECPDWLAGTSPTCCNCTHAKLGKASHNAFSAECAVRIKWDEIARTAVAYC